MKTRTIILWSGVAVLIFTGVVLLFISFGGSEDTPVDVNTVYTDAASTIAAQQQTLQAGMFSQTPDPALLSPTPTFTPLPIATLPQQTPLLLPTVPLGAAVGCDNSIYISDVTIPDGTTIAPGQTFTKTWKVSNTGTCVWTATYQIIFIAGDSMNGKATAIGKVVNPGESVDVSVALTSPAAAGNITGTWRLSNDKALPFGTLLTVVIKSGAVIGTATITPTGATITNTFTPTITLTPTQTETPSNTPETPAAP